jgi:hypothetical protein
MTIGCDCSMEVDEFATLEHTTIRKARKGYHCCECGEPIVPGQKYEHTSSLFDGSWSRHHTCLPCAAIRDRYCPYGFYYGELREHLSGSSCLGMDYTKLPGEHEAKDIDEQDAVNVERWRLRREREASGELPKRVDKYPDGSVVARW